MKKKATRYWYYFLQIYCDCGLTRKLIAQVIWKLLLHKHKFSKSKNIAVLQRRFRKGSKISSVCKQKCANHIICTICAATCAPPTCDTYMVQQISLHHTNTIVEEIFHYQLYLFFVDIFLSVSSKQSCILKLKISIKMQIIIIVAVTNLRSKDN